MIMNLAGMLPPPNRHWPQNEGNSGGNSNSNDQTSITPNQQQQQAPTSHTNEQQQSMQNIFNMIMEQKRVQQQQMVQENMNRLNAAALVQVVQAQTNLRISPNGKWERGREKRWWL